MQAGCVIVGGGHAGFHLAANLRDKGYSKPITIVEAAEGLPYDRPSLSKSYLTRQATREDIEFRPDSYYSASEIRLITGTTARTVDRTGRTVLVVGPGGKSSTLAYDHLVLATGSQPRAIPVPHQGLKGVLRLATIDDADRMFDAFAVAEDVVIVGAGFIGLECAAVAESLGLKPIIVNLAERSLERVASAPLAKFVTSWHEQRGATFLHETSLSGLISENGSVTAVTDSAGNTHPANVVIVGIGASPTVELAEASGLEVSGGILVDEFFRTSDRNIFAIGDCARYPHALIGEALRLESVQNATDHARALAATLVGDAAPYRAVPWFWSDQDSLKIQIAGLTATGDRHVIRGAPEDGKFSVFCYRGDQLIGVDSVGKPADHVQARRLLAANLTPSPEQASDESFSLKSLVAS